MKKAFWLYGNLFLISAPSCVILLLDNVNLLKLEHLKCLALINCLFVANRMLKIIQWDQLLSSKASANQSTHFQHISTNNGRVQIDKQNSR